MWKGLHEHVDILKHTLLAMQSNAHSFITYSDMLAISYELRDLCPWITYLIQSSLVYSVVRSANQCLMSAYLVVFFT